MKPLHYQRRDFAAYLIYAVYLGGIIGLRFLTPETIGRMVDVAAGSLRFCG